MFLVLAFAFAFRFFCVLHLVLCVLDLFPLFWVFLRESTKSSEALVPLGCSRSLDELVGVGVDRLFFALPFVLAFVFAFSCAFEGSLCDCFFFFVNSVVDFDLPLVVVLVCDVDEALGAFRVFVQHDLDDWGSEGL